MLRQIHAPKPQALLSIFHFRLLNTTASAMTSISCLSNFSCKTQEKFHIWRPKKRFGYLSSVNALESNIGYGFSSKNLLVIRRRFSTSPCDVVVEDNAKDLPWLGLSRARGERKGEKTVTTKPRKTSWEESADKFLKGGGKGIDDRSLDNREKDVGTEDEEGGNETIDDPRWDRIRDRYDRIAEVKPGFERPEFKRWNRQEHWGRKTWKDATESTLPRIVGEGIYGVGPVLAALSAGRREFYVLYIQEGLDLSGNNRKKKDKKGVEKVMKMAEKNGLSIKELSKHDLNMITENRPHQGLVLDASPLEMVRIKELEPFSVGEEENGPLWVALDEVTDPHNLGAIIRSAYFFGVSGVVLCSKNSAPLSGVVSKSSAGSLEVMELRSCKNMMQFLTASAENGWRILGGSVTSRAVPLNKVESGAPTILVLGSEGTGLRPLVERCCTQLIRIPGNSPVSVVVAGEDDEEDEDRGGKDREFLVREFNSFLAVESLNVSVAAGVLLHHLIGSQCDNGEDLSTEAN